MTVSNSVDKTTDAIFDLINDFNFERIEKMMHAVDWKWAMYDGLRFPTIDEMRDKCINLLFNAKRNKDTVSSGGFEASYTTNTDGDDVLVLRFVATQHYVRF